MEIKSVMFVCHGNICRSPMAEFILKKMLSEKGIRGVTVASSATSDEEIFMGVGNPIYPPAKRTLTVHGVPFDDHRATRLKKTDYDKYDLIAVMDENNLRSALKIFGGDEKNKVKKLMDIIDEGDDVSDPWYSGDFERAYRDIEKGCFGIMDLIAWSN